MCCSLHSFYCIYKWKICSESCTNAALLLFSLTLSTASVFSLPHTLSLTLLCHPYLTALKYNIWSGWISHLWWPHSVKVKILTVVKNCLPRIVCFSSLHSSTHYPSSCPVYFLLAPGQKFTGFVESEYVEQLYDDLVLKGGQCCPSLIWHIWQIPCKHSEIVTHGCQRQTNTGIYIYLFI